MFLGCDRERRREGDPDEIPAVSLDAQRAQQGRRVAGRRHQLSPAHHVGDGLYMHRMHSEQQSGDEAAARIGELARQQGEQRGGERRPEHIDGVEPVRTAAQAIVERVGGQDRRAPRHPAESGGPVWLCEDGGE